MKQSKKSAKRWHKKQRMAKMCREFFADEKNILEIDDHGLMWAIELHPRLVRDVVLGSRAHSATANHG
jgi:hypothetical protein